jgi:hypothetical protein
VSRFFPFTISINPARANNARDKEIASVEEDDIKKGYCEQPAITVTILFMDAGKPAFFPNTLTAIINNMAAEISNARTTEYSWPLNNLIKGIIESEKPGGKNQYVSKTGLLRFVVKYFVTPIPFPAKRFSAYVN